MRIIHILRTAAALLIAASLPQGLSAQNVNLKSKDLALSLGPDGHYASIKVRGEEIAEGHSPVITVLEGGRILEPKSMKRSGNRLVLGMDGGGTVELGYSQNKECITLEALKVPDSYDAILFGPVKVGIHEIVGDVIGVTRGGGKAFAMQSLNIKTVAGIPQEYVEEVQGRFYSAPKGEGASLSVGMLHNARLAAVDMADGALFHLYARNRSRAEKRLVNGVEDCLVLPVEGPDASIAGAKIAIWGSAEDKALDKIGAVEIEQGLPHPLFDGEWGKTSRKAMRSYLISDFDEEDFDFVLDKTVKAGLHYLYHEEPFANWGHFQFRPDVVSGGDDGMKALADKAAAKDVQIGVHTLSNFMTTNDPYVTPVPSKHLLKQTALTLTGALDETQTEITILDNHYFDRPLTLNALQIDDELITYGDFRKEGGKMTLLDCKRGAFGTTAAAHAASTPLYKLWDYPYRTLFPDLELQDAFADRLAEMFNYTGLAQTSLDGLEGCLNTGQDDYAIARFVDRLFSQVDHNVLNDASRLFHYTWHTATRMNWGEPWGEAMRTGQVGSRIKNQAFFRRNLFPRMLGWFLIRLADNKFECSSLEDLEWALSESAGFDAGYGMTIRSATLKRHGQIDLLLEAMKDWDSLRENLSFTPEQMERLKDPATEWHLDKVYEGVFDLYQINVSQHFTCNLREMQPGQPAGADWNLDNPYEGGFMFRLRVLGDGSIKNPSFYTDEGMVTFDCEVKEGEYLLLGWDGKAVVTDKNYNVISEAKQRGTPKVGKGSVHVGFACEKDKYSFPEVDVRFITHGEPERILIKEY